LALTDGGVVLQEGRAAIWGRIIAIDGGASQRGAGVRFKTEPVSGPIKDVTPAISLAPVERALAEMQR